MAEIQEDFFNRDFKGVWIPRELWLDGNLTILEKAIMAEIDSLSGEKGCYAGNEYFSKFFGCSVTKVSNTVAKLIDLTYIDLEYFNGRQRILRSNFNFNLLYKMQSRLAESVSLPYKKCKVDLQKVQAINTTINTKNNKSNNGSEQVAKPTEKNSDALSKILEAEDFEQELKDKIILWLQYKKEKKSGYKPTGFKVFLKDVKKSVEKHGKDYTLQRFDYSMSKNYQGVFFETSDKQVKVEESEYKRRMKNDTSGFYG